MRVFRLYVIFRACPGNVVTRNPYPFSPCIGHMTSMASARRHASGGRSLWFLSIRHKRLDARVHLWDPRYPRYQTTCMQAGVYSGLRLGVGYTLKYLPALPPPELGVCREGVALLRRPERC